MLEHYQPSILRVVLQRGRHPLYDSTVALELKTETFAFDFDFDFEINRHGHLKDLPHKGIGIIFGGFNDSRAS